MTALPVSAPHPVPHAVHLVISDELPLAEPHAVHLVMSDELPLAELSLLYTGYVFIPGSIVLSGVCVIPAAIHRGREYC